MPTIGTEVFSNPIVKKVIFQIRYPTLIFLKSRVGDFQLEILSEYPESEVLVQEQFVFARGIREALSEKESPEPGGAETIWKFTSEAGVVVELRLDSLTLSSGIHKSYSSVKDNSFRDTIEFVTKALFEIAPVPTLTRVGMRYIDEITLQPCTQEEFAKHFNIPIDFGQYPMENLSEFRHSYVVSETSHAMKVTNAMTRLGDDQGLCTLDMDAFASTIPPQNTLECSDMLHAAIRARFEKTITDHVLERMRGNA